MRGIVYLVAAWALTAHAYEVDVVTVSVETELDYDIRPFQTADGPQLLTVLYDDEERSHAPREIRLFSLDSPDPYLSLELSPDLRLLDVTTRDDRSRLIAHYEGALRELDVRTGTFEPIGSIGSVFRGIARGETPLVDFIRDVDGDDLEDIILADFGGWQIARQDATGAFEQSQLIGPPPFMAVANPVYVMFRAEPAISLDYNLDGRRDIGFWLEGALSVHLQDADGRFAEAPVIFDTGHSDVVESMYSISIGEDEDDDSGPQRVIEAIDDIDDDGFADLILMAILGEGIFGRSTRYEFYFGHEGEDGNLAFAQSPSTTIGSDGIQALSRRADLNDDGSKEVLVTSIDVGITNIIRTLLTRRFSMDVGIYTLGAEGFSERPSVDRSLTAALDLSQGDVRIPALLPADINGDGLDDLLLQDDDELRIYEGIPGPKLFANRASRVSLELPTTQNDFQVVDIDKDGRDELVLRFRDEGRVSVVWFKDDA